MIVNDECLNAYMCYKKVYSDTMEPFENYQKHLETQNILDQFYGCEDEFGNQIPNSDDCPEMKKMWEDCQRSKCKFLFL